MRIALYGDSFACINTKWGDTGTDRPEKGLSWGELLENHGHTISNFAKSGTAFMFSYDHFLREHKNFDLNIFVVTSPERLYVKALDGMCMFGWPWADSEHERVSKLPPYPRKEIHLEILKSVKIYLRDWVDWEMMTHVQHLLVNNLWRLAPNTIVIPAFENSMEQTTDDLFSAAKHELKLVNEEAYNNFDFGWLDCQRKFHFSEENNKVIADLIIDAIENNKKIVSVSTSDMIKPSNFDFSFYVKEHTKTLYREYYDENIKT